MDKQLYSWGRKQRDKSHRKWRVDYHLANDGGGGRWSGYYRTKFGAKVAAFWNVKFASWGGSAVLRNIWI